MPFKFEQLEVWGLSLTYLDLLYSIGDLLPPQERYNLRDQLIRAGTSVSLNIAEGSTGQTDAEQVRFIGMALRSLIETVACQHIIHRRAYLPDKKTLRQAYEDANRLAAKLQAWRRSIDPDKSGYARNHETMNLPFQPIPSVSVLLPDQGLSIGYRLWYPGRTVWSSVVGRRSSVVPGPRCIGKRGRA